MMALFCRIKQSNLNPFFRHFKRCYPQIPIPSLSNHESSNIHTINPKIVSIYPSPVTAFAINARFFAAPIEFLKKVEVKQKGPKKHRLNEDIKADILRLVTDEGHDVISRNEALQRAKRLQLDLVEVDRNANPPVCRIMDYHKERYKRQLDMKERTKIKAQGSLKKGDCKELRFSAKTELKDLQIKADMAKKLMERGYRVKLMALSVEDQDLSGLISQLLDMLKDISFVETEPKFERKQAYFIVRHIKFGPSKKGVKKSSQANSATSSKIQEASTTSAGREDETRADGSDMDNDDEEDATSEEEEDNKRSVSDSKHDTDKRFDLNRDAKGSFSLTPNNTAPGFSHSRPNNFSPPNIGPPAQETENRYARNPRNTAFTGRDSTSRFPNVGNEAYTSRNPRAPQNETPTQAHRDNRRFEPHSNFSGRDSTSRFPNTGNEAYTSRNSRGPQNETPTQAHMDNRRFEPHSNFSGRSSQSTGFGIFSGSKTEASGSPINPSTLKPKGDQGSGAPDSSKFGIFSRENSNSTHGRGRNFHC